MIENCILKIIFIIHTWKTFHRPLTLLPASSQLLLALKTAWSPCFYFFIFYYYYYFLQAGLKEPWLFSSRPCYLGPFGSSVELSNPLSLLRLLLAFQTDCSSACPVHIPDSLVGPLGSPTKLHSSLSLLSLSFASIGSGVMPGDRSSPHPRLSRPVRSTRESPRAPALSARGQT